MSELEALAWLQELESVAEAERDAATKSAFLNGDFGQRFQQ